MDLKEDAGPTLKDLADAAGLSVAAVSKVLNNREGVSALNRRRVMRLAEEMGYRGRGGRPQVRPPIDGVTIVTLDRYVTNNTFYSEIVAGVLEEARAAELPADIRIVASAAIAAGDVGQLWRERPKAAILVGLDRREIIDAVCAEEIPAVIVNGMDRTMRLSSVSPDNHFGGWAATRHLLDLGHRDIVHVTHTHRESIKRRLDGFRDALEEAGIAFRPDRHVLDLGDPNLISIEAESVVGRFLTARDPLPTAFFCVADIVALATIQALQAHGLAVPGDVSVIGFDDLAVAAHATPPLTTMRIDRAELGRVSVRLLMERAAGIKVSVKRIGLGVELVERQSTAVRAR
ncbi:LacI family DNA-binding transcriptional regulator [Azospirillum sp. ST 5-10]|uniref:LacI family DNA-binding transcriptional regulator n=1 Tax=unclassified Azospirillum TaxID=2630922 RepID=UPI003F49C104